jgi:hypothetical protein
MTQKKPEQTTAMTIAGLKQLLTAVGKEVEGDFEVWLSSDEEGNEFLPLSQDPKLCLMLDSDERRIILFPLHR